MVQKSLKIFLHERLNMSGSVVCTIKDTIARLRLGYSRYNIRLLVY